MKPFTLVLTSKKARQLQVIPKGKVMLKFSSSIIHGDQQREIEFLLQTMKISFIDFI